MGSNQTGFFLLQLPLLRSAFPRNPFKNHSLDIRRLIQCAPQSRERLRMNRVICINKPDPLAGGGGEGAVAGGGDAGIALVGDVDAGVEAGVGVEEGGAGIGGAIVDAAGFPIGVGLRADGIEAFREVRGHVVDGDDDGEGGGHGVIRRGEWRRRGW